VFASFESDVHAYLRAAAGDRAVRARPFTVRIDPHDAGLFFNYAIPDDGAEPTRDQVRRLAEIFIRHSRTPPWSIFRPPLHASRRRWSPPGSRPNGRLPILT
jgi:hypothetical protein